MNPTAAGLAVAAVAIAYALVLCVLAWAAWMRSR